MAKPTAAQVANAKKQRDSINKNRLAKVKQMRDAMKAGKKDVAKKYRDEAVALGKKIKGHDAIRLQAKDKAGLKQHATAVGKYWDGKVAKMQERLATVKKKGKGAAFIKAHERAVAVLSSRKDKNKKRVSKWLK